MVKALVTFDPSDCTILESFNVESVTKNNTGNYTINYMSHFYDGPIFCPTPGVVDSSSNILNVVIRELRGGQSGAWTTTIECIGEGNVLDVLSLLGPTDPDGSICFIAF